MKGEKNNGSKMEKSIFADSGCAYGSDYICTAVFAAPDSGQVSTAIESTWKQQPVRSKP